MLQCISPLSLQFELTYKCNNHCVFCYNNSYDFPTEMTCTEINTDDAKKVIQNAKESGIISLNFNGGEPLCREDFFEIAQFAMDCGMDIHLNTNASLITEEKAKRIALLFPSVCTTILSGIELIHDALSGRNGAFSVAIRGIRLLQEQSVYVAVNLMLCKKNFKNITVTLDFLRNLNIRTLLVTRYVPSHKNETELPISDSDFFDAIRILNEYQKKHQCFDRIALPQPIRLCTVPKDIYQCIYDWNIPCNIGLCTASVNAYGELTPCNLVKAPVLGNAVNQSIQEMWEAFDGKDYCINNHLMKKCLNCETIEVCGGGCKGYNSAFEI